VVLIYSTALVLAVLAELPKVQSWAADAGWRLTSGQIFTNFATNLFKLVPAVSDQAEDPTRDQGDSSGRDEAVKLAETEVAAAEPPPAETSEQAAAPEQAPALEETDASEQTAPSEPKISYEQAAVPEQTAALAPDGVAHPVDPTSQNPLTAGSPGNSAPDPSTAKLKPHKVLLVGDSMVAEGFGPALQRRLRKYKSIDVIRKGQYSTGFVHQEDFNWTSVLKELIQKNRPDMIVIHLGTNDPIDILDDSGKRLYFGNDKWREVYSSRVREFLKQVSDKKISSFWVGLPIMSSNKYSEKISTINSIFEEECSKVSGCVFVDSWSALADSDGKYATFVKNAGGKQTRIRAKDCVHLTEAGGDILSQHFLRAACRYVEFPAGDAEASATR
jgi:hypothetical protein